ncbi:BCCT family transporter [Loigolactobacillus backii]|uniref:BCCT family transporter n=1 Tax=Loigolactobacillus backii TaxID=375175 RepID=UPI001CDA6830|nr:BCCT family transporter [Loigolactobacillus backii]MDA5389945.1 BCCT family transporter [Loigolactobacillus backii]
MMVKLNVDQVNWTIASDRKIILKRKNIDKVVFVPTAILFVIASLVLILGGSSLQQGINSLMASITNNMGWLYLSVYVINFIFFIYLAASHYGKIQLGKTKTGKPEYSNFQWGSMVFATAIDASILMLSMVDPIRFLQHPAFGIKPFSEKAYSFASMFGQFDWGPMAWLMFASATIAIAYAMYVKHRNIQRLSEAITLLDGDGLVKHSLRTFIDFLVVVGIMGGIGSSVGMEIPVLSKVISSSTGIPNNLWLTLALFVILLALFATTVMGGLKGGIDRLSSAHIWTALGFLVFILIVGPTLYILTTEGHSLGILGTHFAALSTNMVSNVGSGFAKSETIFYWGWWLSYMPFTGLFIARISKGRTIRQVIVGMVVFGALGCMSFYAILGGYSLYLQHAGILNLAHILNTQGQAAVIASVISTLPLKSLVLIFYSISCFIFLATTISSSAFIVSSLTSLKLKASEEPSRFNRMIWVLIFILFAFGIVMVGGFKTVQTICTMAGFPLIFVCLLLLGSIVKMVYTDKTVAVQRRKKWAVNLERDAEVDFDQVRFEQERHTPAQTASIQN